MRAYPPVEGIGRYIDTLVRGLLRLRHDLEITVLSLWDYETTSIEQISVDDRKVLLLKIPRHGKSIFGRPETVRAFLIPQLINKALRQYSSCLLVKDVIIHAHAPIYIVNPLGFKYGITFYGYERARNYYDAR